MLPHQRRGLLILAAGLLVLAIAGAAGWYLTQDKGAIQTGTTEGTGGAIGGPFTLTDQNGQTRSDAEFRGKYLLVYFGYTYCPDACPTALSVSTQALTRSDPALAAKLQPLFITVDPERDTVESLKTYISHFHPSYLALTGSAEQIATVAQGYRVYYQKVQPEGASDYLMDHTPFMFLMDPNGTYLTHFDWQISSEELTKALAQWVK